MSTEIAEQVAAVMAGYTPERPDATATALRSYWLGFTPKSMGGIKAEQREQLQAVGIPVPALKAIGSQIAKTARKDVSGFIPLARLLWDDYGREGRVVALIILGAMELAEPERVVPLLKGLCAHCISWEDADRLAMDALEPIVRKHPDDWLDEMAAWLDDPNKWVRRAAITVIGRLPMKHPAYTGRCLDFAERLLLDSDMDVKRAVSFAIRICARADAQEVYAFLETHVPAANPAAVWVLCDVIRSMGRAILPAFSPLLPRYEAWCEAPGIGGQDRRSIESAIKVLRGT